MPAIRLRYNDPSAAAGGDGSFGLPYNGASALLAAEANDLQLADERLVVINLTSGSVKDSVGAPDVPATYNTNFETGHYILFLPAPGHEATSLFSNSKYTLATQTIGNIWRDIVFDNIQMDMDVAGASQQMFNFRAGGSNHREIKRCHIRYSGSGGSSNAFAWVTGDINLRLSNNYFDGFPQDIMGTARSSGTYEYSYNSVVNCAQGFGNTGAQLPVARGNLFFNTPTPFSGTWGAGSNHNATDQASLGYTVSGGGNAADRLNQTFTFVDQPGGDYGITNADAGAYQHGIDLRSDPVYPITQDFTGALRGATTSIGAHDPDAVDPPEITNPTGTKTGQTTATGSVDCDVAGADIRAFVRQSNAAQPDEDDLIAGTGAADTGFIDASVIGQNDFSFTGLNPGTEYVVDYIADDGLNRSEIVTSAAFTTDAGLAIVSINAGNPIRDGATANIQWNQDATSTGAATLLGGAQANYQTNVGGDPTVTSVDLSWVVTAGMKYGTLLQLSVDGTHNFNIVLIPAVGQGFTELSGYDPQADGAVTAFPNAQNGVHQFEFQTTDAAGIATLITADGFPEWTLTSPLTADDARTFQYRAIDPTDGSRSAWANIDPPSNVAPVVTTQPSNQAVVEGQTATFTVAFSGAASLQWYRNVVGGSDVELSGETATTLQITTSLSDAGNQYYCIGTNTNGSTQTNTVLLSVSAANTAPVVTPPSATTIEFANGGAGLAKNDATLVAWLASGTASDTEDGSIAAPGDISALQDPIPAGVYNVPFTATDSGSLSDTENAQLTVQEAAAQNTAPVVVAPSPITLEFPYGDAGLPKNDAALVAWLASTANDTEDGVIAATGDISSLSDPIPVGGYDVVFSATDSGGLTDTETVRLTVAEAEAPNLSPVITANAAYSIPENQLFSIDITIENLDGELPTLAGADAGLLSIAIVSGNTYRIAGNARDFESPADNDSNNVYDVQVVANDGVNPAVTHDIAITVTDIDETFVMPPTNPRLIFENGVPVVTPGDSVYAVATFATDFGPYAYLNRASKIEVVLVDRANRQLIEVQEVDLVASAEDLLVGKFPIHWLPSVAESIDLTTVGELLFECQITVGAHKYTAWGLCDFRPATIQ